MLRRPPMPPRQIDLADTVKRVISRSSLARRFADTQFDWSWIYAVGDHEEDESSVVEQSQNTVPLPGANVAQADLHRFSAWLVLVCDCCLLTPMRKRCV